MSCLHLLPVSTALSEDKTKALLALSLTQVKCMKKNECGSVPDFEGDQLSTEIYATNTCDLNKFQPSASLTTSLPCSTLVKKPSNGYPKPTNSPP